MVQKLVRMNFPIVLIDRYLPNIQVDAVVSDNISIGEQLTETLIKRGHRNIAFVTAELESTSAYERYIGYKKALEKNQLEYNPSFLISCFEEKLPEHIYKLFAMKKPPTGIVFSYDQLALIAYQEIVQLGYRVPDEIEFASLGDEEIAQTYKFPLWYFCQNSMEMGRLAFEKLIQRKKNPEKPFELIKLSPVPETPKLYLPK